MAENPALKPESPRNFLALAAVMACALSATRADPALPGEDAYYRLETVTVPGHTHLEVGGLARMADGTVMVGTRRGEVWAWRGTTWRRFATGLDEVMGVWPVNDRQLVVAQRPELTRLTDTDGDGEADRFETLADQWNYSGHVYEWTFGPVADRAGNLYGTLACWFFPTRKYDPAPYSGWEIPPPAFAHPDDRTAWRGWCFQVTPQGEFRPFASGLRSPNGIGLSPAGELFVTDNQGEYYASCVLHHVEQGDFLGHPNGLFWGPGATDAFAVPMEELDRRRKLPAVIFPYGLMGQSVSEPVWDTTAGRFGPFAGQLFVGEQTQSTVMRVMLERVEGAVQGACVAFRGGFRCGVNRLSFGPDGSLLAGETDRGWASVGGQHDGLERVVWTGRMPFEVGTVRARADGFELGLTQPLGEGPTTTNAVTVRHFHYPYHRAYGSPAPEETEVFPVSLEVAPDRRSLRLKLPAMRAGEIYRIEAAGLRSAAGLPPLHPTVFYTLNRVPRQ